MSPEESQRIVQFCIDNWVVIVTGIGVAAGFLITLGMHKAKYDRACSDIDGINERIDSSLTTIIEMLSGNVLLKKNTAKSNSPVTYTRQGLKLLNASNFPLLFESKKALFIDLLTKKEIDDEASLDKACWEVMFNLQDKEIIEPIKEVAYQNGFPEPALRKLCAIYLREELKEDLLPQIS